MIAISAYIQGVHAQRDDFARQQHGQVKKARLEFRTFDPEEHGRLPSGEAINNVAQSLGVITSLLPSVREDAEVHNFRAAFVAGLAMGMDKPLLLLQEGEEPVPLDYRDLVKIFYSLDQINGHIGDFSTEVMARLQARAPAVVSEPQTFLERLNLGASSAENELRELGNYYLETDEFRRVFKGEIRVVTGRKGAGKTALFVQVRDRLRSDRGKVVLDLKPEGFQLLKFKERVLDYLEEGTKTHTITAFWEYLLLLEICYKILAQDEVRHMRNGQLYEPYRRLSDSYGEDSFVAEGDFGERMLKLTQRIAEDFETNGGTSARGQSLSSGQVTELLYKHDVGKLRRQVIEYLNFKESLWILFDNLDKGWPAHGVTAEDVLTLRCLIEALENIERQLDRRDVEAHGTVFIRNDVYELLVENTSDRGKVPQVGLDWTDGDLLRELLRRRFVHTGVEGDPSFEELWRQICCTHVGGEESSQYLIERCLMRPRALIELVGYCRSHAVNLGREKMNLMISSKARKTFRQSCSITLASRSRMSFLLLETCSTSSSRPLCISPGTTYSKPSAGWLERKERWIFSRGSCGMASSGWYERTNGSPTYTMPGMTCGVCSGSYSVGERKMLCSG